MGESIIAVFGTPAAQEDHAQRAVLAGLELQRRLPLPLEALLSLWNPTPEAEEDPSAAHRDKEALLARAGFQPGERVIDIGCGGGATSLANATPTASHRASAAIALAALLPVSNLGAPPPRSEA